jgi:hypothetical protein
MVMTMCHAREEPTSLFLGAFESLTAKSTPSLKSFSKMTLRFCLEMSIFVLIPGTGNVSTEREGGRERDAR